MLKILGVLLGGATSKKKYDLTSGYVKNYLL